MPFFDTPETAWDVLPGMTKTAWDVLSGMANLRGMFCQGCQKWHGMFCPGMFCPPPISNSLELDQADILSKLGPNCLRKPSADTCLDPENSVRGVLKSPFFSH